MNELCDVDRQRNGDAEAMGVMLEGCARGDLMEGVMGKERVREGRGMSRRRDR